MDAPTDPFDWTVDDVVASLCDTNTSWSVSSTPSAQPDPTFFERGLRENDIDGVTLLTELDNRATIQEFLGLRSLGHISKIIRAVNRIRSQSPKYQQHKQEIAAAAGYSPMQTPQTPLIVNGYFHSPSASPWHQQDNLRDLFRRDNEPSMPPPQIDASSQHPTKRVREEEHPEQPPPHATITTPQETTTEVGPLDATALVQQQTPITAETSIKTDMLRPTGTSTAPLTENVSYEPQYPDDAAATPNLGHSAERSNECRSGETFVVDSSGRKRRKLALPAMDTLQTDQVHFETVPETSDVSLQIHQQLAQDMEKVTVESEADADHTEAGGELPIEHSRVRSDSVTPTFARSSPPPIAPPKDSLVTNMGQSDDLEPMKKARPKPRRRHPEIHSYLGPKALPVDFIFYGNTQVGQQLQNDIDHEPIQDMSIEEENWTLTGDHKLAQGQRLYVSNLLRASLGRTTRTQLRRGGRDFIGLKPYSSRFLGKHQSQSFTLVAIDGLETTREDVSKWPELSTPSHSKQNPPLDSDIRFPGSNIPESKAFALANEASSTDQWDYLEKWQYMENDKVEPVYGDSGSENEYDLDTWQQIEAENGDLDRPQSSKRARRPLDLEKVSKAIDACVESLLAKWKERKQPKLERKAWNIWRKSRRDKSRRSLIHEAQEHIERINSGPLAKMRKEILAEIWTGLPKLYRACAILEQTVFNRQELIWRISVLRSKTEPPRPASKVIESKSSKVNVENEAEEGESLDSLSESDGSVDEGLNGFVVDDELSDAPNCVDTEEEETDADVEDVSMSIDEEDSTDEETITPTKRNVARPRTVIEDDEDLKSNPAADTSDTVRATSLSPTLSASREEDELALPTAIPVRSSPRGVDKAKPIDLTLSSDVSTSEVVPHTRSKDNPSDKVKPKIERETPMKSPVETAFVDLGDATSEDSSSEEDLVDEINSGLPSIDDISAISKLDWHTLESRLDRKRLLVKLVDRMTLEQRTFLVRRTATSRFEDMHSDVWDALKSMKLGRERIAGSDETASRHMMSIASLFLMWNQCKRTPPKHGFLKATINQVLSDRNSVKDSFKPFFSFLCRVMKRYDEAGNEVELEIGDFDTGSVLRTPFEETSHTRTDFSPHKTRKYIVPENVAARNLRANDQQRVKDQQKRRQQLQRLMPGIDSEQNPAQILINTSKFEHEDFVFLNPHIGQRVKAHQIEGVQFMWRELVTDERSLQGCLLAHSMGLGKTMQVITLLVTIAEAAKSNNPRISKQIPTSLRESRTLVLCPPSLIDNWWDEFLIWAPEPWDTNIGQLRKVISSNEGIPTRLREISAWYEEGGVLLISYDMFRLLVENKRTKIREAPLSDKQHINVQTQLLEGPNIIVADEAHKMKNPSAGITIAASKFKSKSRIALTGSPLANSIEEYYTMINWVAKGYLGDSVEFRAKYVEPIQEGLYMESSVQEQRRSLKMLHVLKVDLDPKINRADITVLKGSLKPKTEFFIKVPLTKVQADAYTLYVRTVVKGDAEIGWARLWHWLAILTLLNNHPMCFKNKLLAREEEAGQASKTKTHKGRKKAVKAGSLTNVHPASDEENTDLAPGDVPVTKMGISRALIEQELKLLASVSGALESMVHSYKVQVLNQIIKAASEIGEKVLVFSHSLSTLDFLEQLLRSGGRKYSRLDGKTKMANRQQATKDFNTGNTEVYLVSTRAGGLGLNLPGANRVVIFDFSFNPIWEEQAIGRAYRLGQTKPVYVYRFISGGTYEDIVHSKTLFKMHLASRVVDNKNPMRSASRNLRDYLFEPKPVPKENLSEFMGMDPFVLDIIIAEQDKDNSIRSIRLSEPREEIEKLTAEEEAETKQMIKDEQLKRSDPESYKKMVIARQRIAAAEYSARTRAEAATQSHPMAPPRKFGSAVDLRTPTNQSSQPYNVTPVSGVSPPGHPAAQSVVSGTPGLEPIAGANTKVKETTPPTLADASATPVATAHKTIRKPFLPTKILALRKEREERDRLKST
ncbi:MAG: hypothetical protein M1812_003735 [Candelaria pacifica]|nr:MAG: hypothetical protein M1812_003735 [Candelaria pacifica]